MPKISVSTMANHGDEPRTELSQASFEGNVAAVTRLLDSGVDYLEADASGRKALHWAVAQHHLQVVEKLLTHHERKTLSSPVKPAQIHTLTYAKLQLLSLRVYPAVSPLELAAQVDSALIFKVLLENLEPFIDTTVRLNGIWPPISHPPECIPGGTVHRDVLESDLSRNTSLPSRQLFENKGDWQKELLNFVLHIAIKDDKFAVADMALRLGADPGAGCGPSELLPLHVAASCCRDPSYIQLLLKHGANPEAKGRKNKETPLSIAVGAYNEKAVTALLNAGASPNASTPRYISLLYKACRGPSYGSWAAIEIPYVLSTIRALLEAGADVNATPYLMYHAAGTAGGAPIFKELLSWGGKVTETTSNGFCVASNLAQRSSWGTDQEYQAILDIFRTAYNSPSKLREALLAPTGGAEEEIRYSIFLEFGLHVDTPMDCEIFLTSVRGRIRDLTPGLLEVLVESAHLVPQFTTADQLRFCLKALSQDHVHHKASLTAEMAENIVAILRCLDHVGAIDPAMATDMLFDIVKQNRAYGGEIEVVVEALLDVGAIGAGDGFNDFYYDIFALAAIFGHERLLSYLLRRFSCQNNGDEGSCFSLPRWLQESDIPSACLIQGNNVDAVLHCLKSSNLLFKDTLARARPDQCPLFAAVERGDLEAVQKLISLGAYVNKWDVPNSSARQPKDGFTVRWTALHSAVLVGNVPIVEILLQAKAAVNVSSLAHTGWFLHLPYSSPIEVYPLHLAAIHGGPAIVERLLAYGANVNAITDDKETALDFALSSMPDYRHQKVDGHRVAAAALLVERGASVSGLAAKLGKKLGINELLEVFSTNPGLWDTIVAGQ
ncbi:ankyrin repeat-containing domain protein [Coprinopsis sp. MPI-PUGE-AT-0042]|nr:ankyrin repeat-containing domain protein [Coprinopsis sp. MPI-PUGE-AT-0042]